MVGLRVSLCSRCGTLIIIARVRHASPRWQRVLSLAIFSFTFLPHHPLPLVRLALECRFDVTMIKPAEVWPEQAHSRLPPQRGETQGFADSRKASARRGCNSAVRTICCQRMAEPASMLVEEAELQIAFARNATCRHLRILLHLQCPCHPSQSLSMPVQLFAHTSGILTIRTACDFLAGADALVQLANDRCQRGQRKHNRSKSGVRRQRLQPTHSTGKPGAAGFCGSSQTCPLGGHVLPCAGDP